MLWASEFVPAAAHVYRLNHPSTILDTRDIRNVSGADILSAIDMHAGELDLLEGSPPCSGFSKSMNGRDRKWGKESSYSDTSQRVDDLFWEYGRLLGVLQPKAFVAENADGLIVGKSKGYFKRILKLLREQGYRVKAGVIDSAFLDVPQHRRRLFFVGIREDFERDPAFPKPNPDVITLREALEDLPDDEKEARHLREGSVTRHLWEQATPQRRGVLGKVRGDRAGKEAMFSHTRLLWNEPSRTITCSDDKYHPDEPRTLSIREVRRICGFPDDFEVVGSRLQKWERFARAVSPPVMEAIGNKIKEVLYE